jgi:hypothetical protein
MTLQVEYRTADRVIVGVGTEPDNTYPAGYQPAAGDAIASVPDSQYDALLANDTSYLCADGATIRGQPC